MSCDACARNDGTAWLLGYVEGSVEAAMRLLKERDRDERTESVMNFELTLCGRHRACATACMEAVVKKSGGGEFVEWSNAPRDLS